MKQFRLTHPFISATGALLLAVIAFVSGVTAVSLLSNVGAPAETAIAATAAFPAPLVLDPNTLLAKAAVVYDPTTGRILYAKNSQTPLPLASLTKLMTATTVLTYNSGNPSVTISPDELLQGGDAGDLGFQAGDTILLSNLLQMGLIASSNNAMQAAASTLGPEYLETMKKTADSLGLSDMQFYNPTGLDMSTTTAGAYGSAYDMARLAAYFSENYPQYFDLTTQSHVSIPDGNHTLTAAATAVPLENIPGLIGAKTGYTDLAGGNLVAVFDIEVGHPLVAVVLGSTEDGRFSDMQTLIQVARAQTSSL